MAQVPVIYTDNTAVAKMALDATSVKRALHIMRRLAWLQERVAEEDFHVVHLSGVYMTADMNTKVPTLPDFKLFTDYHNGMPTAVGD